MTTKGHYLAPYIFVSSWLYHVRPDLTATHMGPTLMGTFAVQSGDTAGPLERKESLVLKNTHFEVNFPSGALLVSYSGHLEGWSKQTSSACPAEAVICIGMAASSIVLNQRRGRVSGHVSLFLSH